VPPAVVIRPANVDPPHDDRVRISGAYNRARANLRARAADSPRTQRVPAAAVLILTGPDAPFPRISAAEGVQLPCTGDQNFGAKARERPLAGSSPNLGPGAPPAFPGLSLIGGGVRQILRHSRTEAILSLGRTTRCQPSSVPPTTE
jgi:hypothetical protein